MKPKNKNIENVIRFPTGSDLLDIVVGGDKDIFGYPAGKIINIVGDKSSGKSFLNCEIVAAAYHNYKNKLKWIYDDCESGFGFDTKKLYNFEIIPIDIKDRVKSENVEDLYCNVRKFLESIKEDEIGIYVVDSLDGLSSREGDQLADDHYKAFEKGKDFDKGSYKMGKAKYLSQEFFPQLADLIEKKNALLIITSQVRDNIDPMSFEKFARAGGKALDFYCHTVLWLANIHKIKIKNRAIGVTIKAKTTKSKTPRPYREIYLHLYFDYGIHNIATNIDFLFDLLTPTGQLKSSKDDSAKIKWSDNEINLVNIKEFLAKHNIEEWYRKNVKSKLKVPEVVNFIVNVQTNEDIKKAYLSEFTTDIMTRKKMIDFIIKNKLEKILKQRVIDKWEAIEESVKSNLPPKYSE